eukprot:c11292_g1_i1.p3 GENE.c11292_g1_i1~~c11292_g1_i1.p3  ORF type:complete len:119 (+),score=25.40 c11292_g1_i1:425-781(+)
MRSTRRMRDPMRVVCSCVFLQSCPLEDIQIIKQKHSHHLLVQAQEKCATTQLAQPTPCVNLDSTGIEQVFCPVFLSCVQIVTSLRFTQNTKWRFVALHHTINQAQPHEWQATTSKHNK